MRGRIGAPVRLSCQKPNTPGLYQFIELPSLCLNHPIRLLYLGCSSTQKQGSAFSSNSLGSPLPYLQPTLFPDAPNQALRSQIKSGKCNFKFQLVLQSSNKIMRKIELFLVCLLLTTIHAQINTLESLSRFQIPILEASTSAECYDGFVQVNVESGTSSSLTYVACFAQVTNDCSYQKCFNGWIANYTSEETGLVQGYPSNPSSAPVFRLDINSAADYQVKKSSGLSEDFDRLIDIACSQFDPTVASPRTSARSSSSFNLLNGARLNLQNEFEKTYIPQFSFKSLRDNVYSATAASQRLSMSELNGDSASVARTLQFDSSSNLVLERSDVVNLRLNNSALSGSQIDSSSMFDGKIQMKLSKKGSMRYNVKELEAALNRISTVFSLRDLEARRANVKSADLQNFPQLDIQDPPRILENPQVEFSNPLSPTNRGRLLQQGSVYSRQVVLYQRFVFGQRIKVSLLIQVDLINNNQVLVIKGTLKFDFAGRTRSIQVFQRTQNVNFNWSLSNTLSGTLSFSLYIPLPPPVSFMGINFGFSVTYSITINLSANGVPSVNVVTFKFIADVGTALTVQASAALRVVAIEGGVFIQGTLVSVRTDPTLTLKYTSIPNTPKTLLATVDWKFYLRAFQFTWGFFWRHRKLFGGRSSLKIIKSYTITNGVQKTFTLPPWSRLFYL